MRIQKKLIAGLLALPLAYADSSLISGNIGASTEMGVPTIPSSFFTEAGLAGNVDIVVPVTSNSDTGWVLTATSANGSSFNNDNADGNTDDGDVLEYLMGGCTITDNSPTTAGGTQTLLTTPAALGTDTVIASVTDPVAATVGDEVTCTLSLAAGESIAELFSNAGMASYNYTDSVVVSLAVN